MILCYFDWASAQPNNARFKIGENDESMVMLRHLSL